jgi:hypothetical protein
VSHFDDDPNTEPLSPDNPEHQAALNQARQYVDQAFEHPDSWYATTVPANPDPVDPEPTPERWQSLKQNMQRERAADTLNVSREWLNKLLEDGAIPVDADGNLHDEDVLRYKQHRDAKRREALREITRIGQEIEHGPKTYNLTLPSDFNAQMDEWVESIQYPTDNDNDDGGAVCA